MSERHDAIVVGGGHNGLVAAAYLSRAGRSVLVLERLALVPRPYDLWAAEWGCPTDTVLATLRRWQSGGTLRRFGAVVDKANESTRERVSKSGKNTVTVLEGAGLISRGREAQWRPCTLNVAPLRDVDAWMEDYRAHMEASLDRLGDYLRTLTTPPQPDPADDPHDR